MESNNKMFSPDADHLLTSPELVNQRLKYIIKAKKAENRKKAKQARKERKERKAVQDKPLSCEQLILYYINEMKKHNLHSDEYRDLWTHLSHVTQIWSVLNMKKERLDWE